MKQFLLRALLVAVLPVLLGSCDFAEENNLLAITIPLTYEIPVTLPVVYPSNERIAQLQAQNERSVAIVSYVPIDLGEADERIANAEVIEEVRIEAVTMEVVSNTLDDVDLQPFEIRVGEPGTQVLGAELAGEDWDSALAVAVTPVVAASAPPFTGNVPAEINSANQAAASQRIAAIEFGLGFGTSLSIDRGNLPAGGRADVKFTLQLAVVIDPL